MKNQQQRDRTMPEARRSALGSWCRRLAAVTMLLAIAVLQPLSADDPIVLTIAGADAPAPLRLSLDDLRAMGRTEITTTTPWTEGAQQFAGVTGAQLVKAIKASGTSAMTIAVNDYQVVIPFDVLAAESTLIAYERNGAPMTVRDKGPLWIVFPFDSDSIFMTETYKSYSIWSLISVEFR